MALTSYKEQTFVDIFDEVEEPENGLEDALPSDDDEP